ncbi:MAG TPA: hypothetical protein DD412_00890 [Holosporales bacterium]|nr:hypothetical protein [Holosporales bacterium]
MVLILIKKILKKVFPDKVFQQILSFKRSFFIKKDVFFIMLKSKNLSLLFHLMKNDFCLEFLQMVKVLDYSHIAHKNIEINILSLEIKNKKLIIILNDKDCDRDSNLLNITPVLPSIDSVYIECIKSWGIPEELRGMNKKVVYGKEILSILVNK